MGSPSSAFFREGISLSVEMPGRPTLAAFLFPLSLSFSPLFLSFFFFPFFSSSFPSFPPLFPLLSPFFPSFSPFFLFSQDGKFFYPEPSSHNFREEIMMGVKQNIWTSCTKSGQGEIWTWIISYNPHLNLCCYLLCFVNDEFHRRFHSGTLGLAIEVNGVNFCVTSVTQSGQESTAGDKLGDVLTIDGCTIQRLSCKYVLPSVSHENTENQ